MGGAAGVLGTATEAVVGAPWRGVVTPGFKDKTEYITICMPGSSFIHIETL